MFDRNRLVFALPQRLRTKIDGWFDAFDLALEVRDVRVLRSLGPSGVRGLVLQRGKQGRPTQTPARHAAHFDWTYPSDYPEMHALYIRAKRSQWDADTRLDWTTSVDPYDPATPLLPESFIDFDGIEALGVKLDPRERLRFTHDLTSWLLSQFLHGEQGALFAAAQVTEAVSFFDGKLYGATQVMDEGRHVEVFHRYLEHKLGKLYQVNDNLFVIIDALMTDPRWDMKFLGMQIMVEGLALGAFGAIYRQTKEPLLKALLKAVIQDESRHVHYGVLALRDHFRQLSERERSEREDWAFEVALLMRNRFLAHEVYEEWFAHKFSRASWCKVVSEADGMRSFRRFMFTRLVPNLREIGLISPRIVHRYQDAGLAEFMGGLSADRLDGDGILADLDRAAA